MPKKQNTFVNEILEAGYKWGKFVSAFVPPQRLTMHRAVFKEYHHYKALEYMERRGLITAARKKDKKFYKLTKKGQLELLLAKAHVERSAKWDGKWRMVIFDIPEDGKKQRDRLRHLLKTHNFLKLQASVYISPHPLNREGLQYLKTSGLMTYIRMLRIDDMDDDSNLRKKFHLKK